MRREYTYENAIVCIDIPENFQMSKFKKATEKFLRRVLEEESEKGGNRNSSGAIRKK